MNRTSFSYLLLGCLLFHGQANAAVMELDWKTPGDGLLTLDTLTHRQWLDLTETQLFKFPGNTLEERYQAVLAETAPGGMFAGFTPAISDDVFALAESAGIDTSTGNFMTNSPSVTNLIGLVGVTLSLNINKWSIGALNEIDSSQRLTGNVANLPGTRGAPIAGFGFDFNTRNDNGVWLFHQIPEPSSIYLMGVVLVVLSYRRNRLLTV